MRMVIMTTVMLKHSTISKQWTNRDSYQFSFFLENADNGPISPDKSKTMVFKTSVAHSVIHPWLKTDLCLYL